MISIMVILTNLSNPKTVAIAVQRQIRVRRRDRLTIGCLIYLPTTKITMQLPSLAAIRSKRLHRVTLAG